MAVLVGPSARHKFNAGSDGRGSQSLVTRGEFHTQQHCQVKIRCIVNRKVLGSGQRNQTSKYAITIGRMMDQRQCVQHLNFLAHDLNRHAAAPCCNMEDVCDFVPP